MTMIALVLPLLWGCGAQSVREDKELWVLTEQTTWDRMNGQLYVLEEAYETEHPGVDIRVEYLPSNEQERTVYLQQLRTQIIQGGGPDCYLLPTDNTLILDEPAQYTFVDVEPLFSDVDLAMGNGLFYDITEFYDADNGLGKEVLNTRIMDAGVVDERRYVLPLRYDIPVIYGFHDALEAAGLDPAILHEDLGTIMESVYEAGDPALAGGLLRDELDVFSRLIDYDSGNAVADEAVLTRYMENYRMLKSMVGTAYLGNNWNGDGDLFCQLLSEGSVAVEKLNVRQYIYCYYDINQVEYYPLWIGSIQDAFDYVPVSKVEYRELTVTPMRTMEGDVAATVTYYAAVGSGCRNPELAYDFLRQFLLEESQWEQNRPTRNHTKPLKGSGNTANDMQYPGLLERGWPVRDGCSLDTLWNVRRKQIYVRDAFFDSANKTDLAVERERRNRRIGRMGELEEDRVPLFDVTIDEVRFNTTLSDGFADALAQLNNDLGEPTQANVDELARRLLWNLRWHVAEG